MEINIDKINLGGFKFDAFICDNGDLGFTVEIGNKSRDIFVRREDLKVTSDYIDPDEINKFKELRKP